MFLLVLFSKTAAVSLPNLYLCIDLFLIFLCQSCGIDFLIVIISAIQFSLWSNLSNIIFSFIFPFSSIKSYILIMLLFIQFSKIRTLLLCLMNLFPHITWEIISVGVFGFSVVFFPNQQLLKEEEYVGNILDILVNGDFLSKFKKRLRLRWINNFMVESNYKYGPYEHFRHLIHICDPNPNKLY